MEKKFKILRFIGGLYKVLGIITAVVTVLGAVAICLASILGGAIMDQVQSQFGDIGPVGLMGGAAGGGYGDTAGPAGCIEEKVAVQL